MLSELGKSITPQLGAPGVVVRVCGQQTGERGVGALGGAGDPTAHDLEQPLFEPAGVPGAATEFSRYDAVTSILLLGEVPSAELRRRGEPETDDPAATANDPDAEPAESRAVAANDGRAVVPMGEAILVPFEGTVAFHDGRTVLAMQPAISPPLFRTIAMFDRGSVFAMLLAVAKPHPRPVRPRDRGSVLAVETPVEPPLDHAVLEL